VGLEPAGTWGGQVFVEPVGGDRSQCGPGWLQEPATASFECCGLIILFCRAPAGRTQGTVSSPSIQSITYSYSLKIIAAHLLLPVQLVMAHLGGDIGTAVLNPSSAFSMATNQRGWEPRRCCTLQRAVRSSPSPPALQEWREWGVFISAFMPSSQSS
jgi:hypothetical protein